MSKYKRYERYKDLGIEWIGEIPEHWEITKLKYICSESAVYGLNESAENYVEEGVRFIRTTDIDNKGNLDNSMGGVFLPEEKVKGYILKTGDLLVSRSGSLGTSLYFDEDKYGKCSYAGYLVKFRANSKNCPKFLFYFSKSNIFYIQIQLALVSSTISNFNGNKYANMILPLPSYYEQKAISNFLDQKTAEIDGLIADKEKLIELLQEKRQAIITEAVTKGLNPNVRLKDSGIEWIGEIPEHWEVTKVKYYYDVCLGKMIQSNQEDYSDTLEYYLCAINVTWDGIDISNLKEMWFSNEDKKKYSIKSGDLIVCEGGDVGRASIWDGRVENCYIQNAVHRVREKKNSLNKYLYYWLYFLKHAGYIDLICNKATIMHYTYEKFLNTILVIPHLGEQQEIINYLDEKIEEINSLKKEIEQQIQNLKEYRQSLISETVTGKIDVREFQKKNEVIFRNE